MDSSYQMKLQPELNKINSLSKSNEEKEKLIKQNKTNKKLKFVIIISFILLNIFLIVLKRNYIFNENISKNKSINYFDNNSSNYNNYNETYINKSDNNNDTSLIFNLINNQTKLFFYKKNGIKYNFSYKFDIVQMRYNISIYDENNISIKPSDLSFLYNIHLFCLIKNVNNNTIIYSYPNIIHNKYFSCVEYFNIYDEITFGIKIYDIIKNITYNYIMLFTEKIFNYNIIRDKDDLIFDFLIINNKYSSLLNNINNNKKLNKLKSSYIKYPCNSLKRNCYLKENTWEFQNNFGDYFCFCNGQNCSKSNISQNCKFYFYIYLIDNNRELYLKTDYLFADFIFSELSSDDAYPVFQKMINQNYPAHYITEKIDIYQKYCNKTNECLTIIPITKENYYNNGDFLQKYLNIILKSKAFISGKSNCYNGLSILFYNIEYIVYIGVGHGICYFKDYLYKENRLYGTKNNDKILLPPSEKIIFLAKKYGWKDENIIKINLPRWDKYNNEQFSNDDHNKFTTRSIFLMFTWRAIKKVKDISYHYINNTISLLTNNKLKNALNEYNITLHFSFHRFFIDKYKKKFNNIISNKKYINFINQNEISDCICKSSLVISDFSSIIFDFIYRRKPFIIYIPDANDPSIKNIYYKDYYQLIESLKNDSIYFENKFFEVNSVVDKIIYYIKNNFNIEKKLSEFYDSFELNKGSNINNFIKYLHNLK